MNANPSPRPVLLIRCRRAVGDLSPRRDLDAVRAMLTALPWLDAFGRQPEASALREHATRILDGAAEALGLGLHSLNGALS